jgi:hypothetical protein
MDEKDVIKIVEDLFETTLVAMSDDPFCGATIEGKEQFFNELKVKLKELFDDNDLSK